MSYIIAVKVDDPRNYLSHDLRSFLLAESPLRYDLGKEIAAFAELHNHDILVLPLKNLEKFVEIGVICLHGYRDLTQELLPFLHHFVAFYTLRSTVYATISHLYFRNAPVGSSPNFLHKNIVL